jgi:hypothetical protein
VQLKYGFPGCLAGVTGSQGQIGLTGAVGAADTGPQGGLIGLTDRGLMVRWGSRPQVAGPNG